MDATISKYKNIGILGGMGAAASADFYRELVGILQKEHHAEQDSDFPPMFIYNLPLTGFDETGFANEALVKKQLLVGVQKLENAGSDFVVIPCNTVHHFEKDMREAITAPLLSIIEATVDEVEHRKFKKVGLLTSQSTRKYGLYETGLRKRGIDFLSVTDEEQKEINAVIHHVIGGTHGIQEVLDLHAVISRLQNEGAEAIILGCTGLPLAISQEQCPIPLLNSTHILAKAAIEYSLSN